MRVDRAARPRGDRIDHRAAEIRARAIAGPHALGRRRRRAVGAGARGRARARRRPRRGAPPPLIAELPRTGAGGAASRRVRTSSGRPRRASASHDVLAEPGVVHVTLPAERRPARRQRRRPARGGRRRAPARPRRTRRSSSASSVAAAARARRQQRADRVGRHQRRDGLAAGARDRRAAARRHRQARTRRSTLVARAPWSPAACSCASTSPTARREWRAIGDLLRRRRRGRLGRRTRAGPARRAPRRARVPAARSRLRPLARRGSLRFGDGRHGRRPPRRRARWSPTTTTRSARPATSRPGAIAVGALAAGRDQGHQPGAHLGRRGPRDASPTPSATPRATCSTATGSSPPPTSRRSRCRTPGVDVGRVEVVPCYDPQLGAMPPGDAAGCVTVLAIPRNDPLHPETPEPDQDVPRHGLPPPRAAPPRHDRAVRARPDVRRHLDHRRLPPRRGRGPRPRWSGRSQLRLRRLLAALDPAVRFAGAADRRAAAQRLAARRRRRGGSRSSPKWPGPKASSTSSGLRLAVGAGGDVDSVSLAGLELPRVLGVLCAAGDPPDLDAVRGGATAVRVRRRCPLPALPEDC